MKNTSLFSIAIIASLQLAMGALNPASAQGFTTNGSASLLSGNCYQLTPDVGGQAGTVFSTNSIDLTQPFTINAVMQFGCKDVNGADGIVFILAQANNLVGVGGGEIGYGGITPSIAIEYDDYQNGWGDPAQDHMAVISNGSLSHNAGTNLVGPFVISQIEDCGEHCFVVSWDPVTQTILADLDGWEISYTGDIVNTIFGGNPIVYYGFSSGTGSLSNQHVVCIGPPVLDPMEDVTICAGEDTQLEADENGVSWQWASHPTLSSTTIRDPIATPTQTTQYTVTIEYPCGGTANDTVMVTVIPQPTGSASNNGPLCEGQTLVLSATGGIGYLWSGPMGFTSTNQNPQILNATGGHSGTYNVTITDAAGCTAVLSTAVVVNVPQMVDILPPDQICENDGPVQLIGTPPGGIWSGDIGSNGIFDPVLNGAGFHDVYYTITDINGCTNTAYILVEVVPNTPALIIPDGPFCLNDPIQVLSATPAGGVWGDAADPNGWINPAALGVGVHLVTYTYADQNGCFDADLFIEVFAAPQVSIEDVPPICPNDSIQLVVASPPGGIWGGVFNSSGMFDPAMLGQGTHIGTYTLEDVNGCAGADTVDITILPAAPVVSNVELICDSAAVGFVVSFAITGGDAMTYAVTGAPGGTLVPGTPYMFVSDTISQGGSYNFTVDDQYHCDPTVISGSFACSCATQTGTMDPLLIQACVGDTIQVPAASGAMLDPDDALVYILHHGSSNFLDNIVAWSASPVFAFQPPIQPGITYYVSAVTGNAGPPYGVDISDPCLDVSVGTPVRWIANPTGYMNGPQDVCVDDTFHISLVLTGGGPFDVILGDGATLDTLYNIMSGQNYQLVAGQSLTLSLLTVYNYAPPGCESALDTSLVISVHDKSHIQNSASICAGDTIVIHGEEVTTAGTYTFVYSNLYGCDSTVQTDLVVYMPSTTAIQKTSCDSSQVGVFEEMHMNANGCDSLVTTTVTYALSDTTYLTSATCDASAAGTFTSLYQSNAGCDSVVIESIVLSPGSMTQFTSQTCDSTMAGVFIDTFANVFGCDSIVMEQVDLMPSWDVMLTSQTCDPLLAGTYQTYLVTNAGCDSIVTETIFLLQSDTTLTTDITCEKSETGVTMMHYTNSDGCDSVVILTTSLDLPEVCDPEVVVKNVFVPNVFSPNGDGANDVFTVYADPAIVTKVHFLRVFDRWGAMIDEWADFLPGDQGHAWDGTYRNKPLDPAVFVWVLQIEYYDGTTDLLYGDVALVR